MLGTSLGHFLSIKIKRHDSMLLSSAIFERFMLVRSISAIEAMLSGCTLSAPLIMMTKPILTDVFSI